MESRRFKGLTWDHPRGYRALEAAARTGSRDYSIGRASRWRISKAIPLPDLAAPL